MRLKLALILAVLAAAPAGAEAAEKPYLDIPITQRINRDGTIRFGVWVKVGERSVEAMLDTGSTGLRVLPSVFHDRIEGIPTDVAFGAGLHMGGIAVKAPIEIGSIKGAGVVEVVQSIACVSGRANCSVQIPGVDSYLIGGSGSPSEGYSAILGIGMPFGGTDIENPLVSLGVKRWIIDLPRPYARAEGHLILDPEDKKAEGFVMLAHRGIADADGCIEGGSLAEKACGTILFDTGAPAMDVTIPTIAEVSAWDAGARGRLSFKVPEAEALTLDFASGENEGLAAVTVTPKAHHDFSDPFILAGVAPFFAYDILYDQASHMVGLKKREADHAPRKLEAAAEPPAPRQKLARPAEKPAK